MDRGEDSALVIDLKAETAKATVAYVITDLLGDFRSGAIPFGDFLAALVAPFNDTSTPVS